MIRPYKAGAVRHMKSCPDVPDHVDLIPCPATLGNGDLQSVELGQLRHLLIAVDGGSVYDDCLIAREKLPSRSDYRAGVTIDDFAAFEKEECAFLPDGSRIPFASAPPCAAAPAALKRFKEGYGQVLLAQHESREVGRQPQGIICDSETDGIAGIHSAPFRRILAFASLTDSVVDPGLVEVSLLEGLDGSWNAVMLHNRRFLCLIDLCYDVISRFVSSDVVELSLRMQELTMIAVLALFIFTDMRSLVSTERFTVDASSQKMAVSSTLIPYEAARELNKRLSTMLPTVIGSRIHSKGFWLPSERNLCDDPTRDSQFRLSACSSPGWYQGLCEFPRNFAELDAFVRQMYDFSDIPQLSALINLPSKSYCDVPADGGIDVSAASKCAPSCRSTMGPVAAAEHISEATVPSLPLPVKRSRRSNRKSKRAFDHAPISASFASRALGASFSIAVTPPVRNCEFPAGAPRASDCVKRRIGIGNYFCTWCAEFFRLSNQCGVICWIEKPAPSWLWRQRCFVRLLHKDSSSSFNACLGSLLVDCSIDKCAARACEQFSKPREYDFTCAVQKHNLISRNANRPFAYVGFLWFCFGAVRFIFSGGLPGCCGCPRQTPKRTVEMHRDLLRLVSDIRAQNVSTLNHYLQKGVLSTLVSSTPLASRSSKDMFTDMLYYFNDLIPLLLPCMTPRHHIASCLSSGILSWLGRCGVGFCLAALLTQRPGRQFTVRVKIGCFLFPTFLKAATPLAKAAGILLRKLLATLTFET